MDTRTEEEKNRHFTPEELEESVNEMNERNFNASPSMAKIKHSKPRTSWQRSATMPVFYKSKARAKNKLQKMSRKANR